MVLNKSHWLHGVLFEIGKQLEHEGHRREAVAILRLNAALMTEDAGEPEESSGEVVRLVFESNPV